MTFPVKTVQEETVKALTLLESKIAVDSPLNDESFLQVLSLVLGISTSSLYKFGNERALQALAATATLEGLKDIGLPYGVIYKEAQAAILNISLPATDGTIIPDTVIFTGDDNGEKYRPDNPVTAAGGSADLVVTAENSGTNANLPDASTLTINVQIPGAETVATVTSTDTLGTEDENFQLFRQRVFNAIRRKAGGGNSSDIRTWGEAVAGVAGIYPYTGRPYEESPELSVSPERTVYVEATTDIDPDGIAPPALLDAVKAALKADPETGLERRKLGETQEKLYVRSIERVDIYTEVRDLSTPAGQETQIQTAIASALTVYYASLKMFIAGLDFEGEKNDEITDLAISDVIQDVLKSSGSSARAAGFGFMPGVFEGIYILLPGKLVKNAGVTFAP
jgi:hypothetical protein